ncbi:phosphodiester glycosidase family protein [Bacteroides heparinolyticus]|uniref:phosphodiester glycosidase family protein n=1 Tax=Prevotella heparinolytica TaxID=28113 RepID=UPI0035A179BC
MLVKRLFVATSFLSIFLFCSCGGESYPKHEWEWEEEESVEKNPDIVKLGWTPVTSMGKLPDYLQVYKSPSQLEGVRVIAYIAVADMGSAQFNVLGNVAYSQEAGGYADTVLKTPSEFYADSQCPLIINAGLFYGAKKGDKTFYYSQNLVVRDGKLLAPNQNYYSKDWVTLWYPTLGAFCLMKDGTYRTTWTYFTSDKKNYCYPAPAPNNINTAPLQVPSSAFPLGAQELDAVTAIGGVGVLLHGGQIKNTYVEEMLDVSATTNQPRTAIGITADKKMVLFVCEGRNMTEGVPGLSTAKVAAVLKALGCIEALNLDGGGSSCMLVNGKETIKGCDGKQRKVLTAVGLR